MTDFDFKGAAAPVRRLAAPLLMAGLVAVPLSACGPGEAQDGAGPAPTVTVAAPEVRRLTEWDEYTGRFVPTDSVEIRSRVGGALQRVHFEDGQIVRRGDLLFTIDPRPFEAALDQAQAQVQSAETRAELAAQEFRRAELLRAENAISQEEFEQRATASREAVAALASARAAARQAALDLEFTQVRAPMSGRISDRKASPGTLVASGPGSPALATIVSQDPIYFEFTADEAAYLRYVRLNAAGSRRSGRDVQHPVRVRLMDEDAFTHQGRLVFVDNVVARGAGTMRGRALLENDDGLFTPGMFGRLQLLGSGEYEALIVPDAAIGADQTRRFVYVLSADGAVEQRLVELGPLLDGQARVIRAGLTAQDRVVVNGMMRIRPGARPQVQEAQAAPAQPS